MLGLFLLMGILVVGGVGVDIMRHDHERLRMQSTLDTAILAAADLDQRRDPETVVRDFFNKAGMADRIDSIHVANDINSRVVSAKASMDLPTMFMKSVGIDTLANRTAGMAREDIRDIEVSMILDISGSMNDHGRIQNLRTAAKRFVSTVLTDQDGTEREDVSINLVPYASQVALGPDMLSQFNLTKTHDYSTCVDLETADFNSLSLDPSTPRRQTAMFDRFTWSNNVRRNEPLFLSCRIDPASTIRYMSHDIQALNDHLDALQPGGNTSIDLGLRWGAALLDPSMRSATGHLIETGQVEDTLSGRPFAHDRPNTMKIIVLMTDGENTTQDKMKDAFAGDLLSDVFVYVPTGNASDLQFSVKRKKDGVEDFYNPSTKKFEPAPRGGERARELSYAELWATGNLNWNATYLRPWDGRGINFWRNSIFDTIGRNVKDPRMTSLCNLAKDAGIIVFTVALDVSESNATRMRNCASTENHYFNVTGNEIVYAFGAIAGTINQLKLVQ